jgi:hypothetical protein
LKQYKKYLADCKYEKVLAINNINDLDGYYDAINQKGKIGIFLKLKN